MTENQGTTDRVSTSQLDMTNNTSVQTATFDVTEQSGWDTETYFNVSIKITGDHGGGTGQLNMKLLDLYLKTYQS